jgi:prepilin-type processing-associated H-X9-DG protein
MYKITGSDGKEYGPVSVEQLQKWVAEGRANGQTRIQPVGATEWKAISEIPELNALLQARATVSSVTGGPPAVSTTPLGSPAQGLATASLVLGIISVSLFFVCFGLLAGIPAVICGHIARNRAQTTPSQYGGAGRALAGLVMGYFGLALSVLILPAMLLPALAKAKERAIRINCVNNLKQVGLAYKTWALDHQDQFPWNVSSTQGGTMEFAVPGADNLDPNPIHFQVISNELNITRILVCPGDKTKMAAIGFRNLTAANISYQLHSGSNVGDLFPQQILVVCPIHNNVLFCDGSVQQQPPRRSRY